MLAQEFEYIVSIETKEHGTVMLGNFFITSNGLIECDARDKAIEILRTKGLRKEDINFRGSSFTEFFLKNGAKVKVDVVRPFERFAKFIVDYAKEKTPA